MTIQLAKREGQRLIIHFPDLVPVGEEEDLEALEKQGYHILILSGPNGDFYWRTKENDGYSRDLRGVTWYKGLEINPYETDPSIWSQNVGLWFAGALKNDEYIQLVEATIPSHISVLEIMQAASEQMANTHPRRTGKPGKRRGDIDNWFRKERNSFLNRYCNRNFSNLKTK